MVDKSLTREDAYKMYFENGLTRGQAARALQIVKPDSNGRVSLNAIMDRLNYTLRGGSSTHMVSIEFNEKCRKAGVAPRADLLNRYPDKSHEEIIAELLRAKALRECCKSCGISESSIKTIIKNLNVSDETAMQIVQHLSTKTFPYKKFIGVTKNYMYNGDAHLDKYKYTINRLEEVYGGVYEAVYRLMYPRHIGWKTEEYMPSCMSDFYKIYKRTLPKTGSYLEGKRTSLIKFVEKYNKDYTKVNNNFGGVFEKLITDEELNDALALVK